MRVNVEGFFGYQARQAFIAAVAANVERDLILADAGLDAKFLEDSHAAGLTNLKGHRSVGGMRASIYNAVSEEAVDALITFMAEFERTHG